MTYIKQILTKKVYSTLKFLQKIGGVFSIISLISLSN